MLACVLLSPGLSQAQDAKDGDGKMTLSDGSVYEGQFKDGVFDGKGTLTYANGEQYTGEFKNGLYDGNGVLLIPMGVNTKANLKKAI